MKIYPEKLSCPYCRHKIPYQHSFRVSVKEQLLKDPSVIEDITFKLECSECHKVFLMTSCITVMVEKNCELNGASHVFTKDEHKFILDEKGKQKTVYSCINCPTIRSTSA